MNFWVTELTNNWVSFIKRFFTRIAAWSQWNVYNDKEPNNVILNYWSIRVKALSSKTSKKMPNSIYIQ